MALTGKAKEDNNFVKYRAKKQVEFWPDEVVRMDDESNGVRYKSEVFSYTDLWRLYTGTVKEEKSEVQGEETEEESRKANKSKKDKLRQLEPISYRRYLRKGGGIVQFRCSDDGYLHFDQWLRARDQARKELFWLCKEMFGMDVVSSVHQQVCDNFVQKNFDSVFKQGYSLQDFTDAMHKQSRVPVFWVDTGDYEPQTLKDFGKYISDPVAETNPNNFARDMILLDPRGFFKSTIDGVDCVQWIINCPDVRILIFGGVKLLAQQFLQLAKSRFYLPQGEKGTGFHHLFPEFILRGIEGDSAQPMYSPVRVHDLPDPTLGMISIGSSLSGFHCDVEKFDDVVTDENSNTEETRQAIELKASGARNLMMPWGWRDIIGTRYWVSDYYGSLLERHRDDPEDFPMKYHCRAAWIVKEEFEHLHIRELKEDMVTMVFPSHSSFKYNRSLLKQNERSFRCQQLNEPQLAEESFQFDETLLRSHVTNNLDAQKQIGQTYVAWDCAKSANRYSDFSCGVAARIVQKDGKHIIYVLEVTMDRWNQHQLAHQIAAFNNKWNPLVTIIEDTGGLDLLRQEIDRQSMHFYGTRMLQNVYWMTADNKADAKRNRIMSLNILLQNDQLFFADGGWIDDIFRQFLRFTGIRGNQNRKDDAPDAISMVCRYMPGQSVPLSKAETEARAQLAQDMYQKKMIKGHYDRVFGADIHGQQNVNYDWRAEPSSIEQRPNNGAMSDLARKVLGNGPWRA